MIAKLEWAIDTIREQVMFGMDDLGAAKSRERRAKGVMIDACEYIKDLEAQIKKAESVIRFYADKSKYFRPDRDKNGLGGMSAQTDFEIEDGEWNTDENGEKSHYCYGKKAREYFEGKEVGK